MTRRWSTYSHSIPCVLSEGFCWMRELMTEARPFRHQLSTTNPSTSIPRLGVRFRPGADGRRPKMHAAKLPFKMAGGCITLKLSDGEVVRLERIVIPHRGQGKA